MLTRGRETDDSFEPAEPLFIRFQSDQADGEKLLTVALKFLRFPNTSINRGKYGEPFDVLIPIYGDWGIAQFNVSDVSAQITKGDDSEINVKPIHCPEVCNYAHSEIAVFDSDQKMLSEVSSSVKKTFRDELAKAKIIKQADISSKEWSDVKSDRMALKLEAERRVLHE
jgi:hypothetical protein